MSANDACSAASSQTSFSPPASREWCASSAHPALRVRAKRASTGEHALSAAPLRSRRARGLFERLRQTRRGESEALRVDPADAQFDAENGTPFDGLPQSYGFLGADDVERRRRPTQEPPESSASPGAPEIRL